MSGEPGDDVAPTVTGAPATDAAAALLGALVARGVRHVVLSPGSRSQALALVAAELERRGHVQLHVRVDERVAGFTALGIARETRVPAAVVCTSGTAVANLLPAVLEAHHAGVPLLLLTADRPPELRGVGANQTTRQPGLFSSATRYAADLAVPEKSDPDGTSDATVTLRVVAAEAVDAARGVGQWSAGPVHLNLPYREPLSGPLPAWLDAAIAASAQAAGGGSVDDAAMSGALYQGGGGIGSLDVADEAGEMPVALDRGPRTVVVAGAAAAIDAAEAAASTAPAPQATAVVAPPPSPAPAPTPAPARASGLEKPFIQIGIFSVEENARNTATAMRQAGMVPTVLEQNSQGKAFWRVIVGPATNASERSALLKKIQGIGFEDAYAVTN